MIFLLIVIDDTTIINEITSNPRKRPKSKLALVIKIYEIYWHI